MADDDEIRASQRAAWARLSGSWDRWDAVIQAQLGPAGDAMIDRLGVAADQRHLDVASGTGEPGLSVARRAPNGRVVLTDLSPEMLEVAERRAAEERLANVEAVVCSADDLPFDDGSFTSVSVRFGYMFFPDLAAATSEFVRVLAPGGRLAASVWVRPDRNPWTSIVMDAIATETTIPPPEPDRPSMFRCAGDGAVASLFERAGLHDVDEWEVELELVTASPDEYWEMIADHVSLVSATLQRVDPAARERVRARAIEEAREFERDGVVRVPGVARCVVGTKPIGTIAADREL